MSYKTQWNIKLLYTSDTDPRIEKDLRRFEQLCSSFEKKYKNKQFTSSPQKLAAALCEYKKIILAAAEEKPWWYFALKTSLDAGDTKAEAKATMHIQRIIAALNKVQFFELEIGKIPSQKQKIYLKHPLLKEYTYQISCIFKSAQYRLTEPEEQLASLLSQTSYQMWKDSQEKHVNSQTISFKGKDVPLGSATNHLPNLPAKDRAQLQTSVNEKMKSISHFAEAELNAIYNYKKVMDERRGYPKPYSSTAIGHEMDEGVIEMLTSLITGHFSISKRFYAVHAKLLGMKKLTYADRTAKAGNIRKKFSFNDSVTIVRSAFRKVDEKYAGIVDSFLENGQIDVFPKKGKHGGAFCWGGGYLPTYVLLNHVDNIMSVETFGHEMGHAVHGELSKRQPPQYQGHTTATAEVASTFFEQVTSEEIEKHLSAKEKILFLHNKLVGDISTIFRQVACFNFEVALHKEIRTHGQISKEKIADLMAKHLQAYVGPAMKLTHDDGYTFVSWSHIRSFFYVYSYAYGQLISKAMFEKWKQDPSYAKKIEQFLKAGRSMSPKDIFKSIGIDTTKPEFFLLGLKSIEHDIAKLEKIAHL